MPAYFIVNVRIKDATKRELYDEYILKVNRSACKRVASLLSVGDVRGI